MALVNSNLRVTISRVSICLKGKTSKKNLVDLETFVFLVSPLYFLFIFFVNGPRTNCYVQLLHLYSLTISDRKFDRKVYIFFVGQT